MALTAPGRHPRTALLSLSLVSRQLDSLSRFYHDAFGFRCSLSRYRSAADLTGMPCIHGGVRSAMLELGGQCLELLEFDQPGRAYPADDVANSPAFQHFAIVVSDMSKAFRQLASVPGWSPITHDGPQQLPESSGGVTAFKFRDPEGHPLELLAFPKDRVPSRWQGEAGSGVALGIDHTAIVVTNIDASVAFYRALGLRVATSGRNTGEAQSRLDGLTAPDVGVIALDFSREPHLELLCYRSPARIDSIRVEANDVAATRTVMATLDGSVEDREIRDPDGHRIVMTQMDSA